MGCTSTKLMQQQRVETQSSVKSLVKSFPEYYKDFYGLEKLRNSQNIEVLKALDHTQREQRRLQR